MLKAEPAQALKLSLPVWRRLEGRRLPEKEEEEMDKDEAGEEC